MRIVTKTFFLANSVHGQLPSHCIYSNLFIDLIKMIRLLKTRQQGRRRGIKAHITLSSFLPLLGMENCVWLPHLFALLLERSDLNPLEPSRKAHAWYRLERYNFSKSFPSIFKKTTKVYKQWIKTLKSHSEIVKIWVKHSHKV